MNKFETSPAPKKPGEFSSVQEAEEIIQRKVEAINGSPKPTEASELSLESPEETEWNEKITEMKKRADDIAIQLEKQRIEEEQKSKTVQIPEEMENISPIEEIDPKTEREVNSLKNFIESYIKQYVKDLNDIKWLETIGEERKNKLTSFLSGELDHLIFNKDHKEASKITEALEKSLSPVGKEIFKEITENHFA